MSYTRVSNLASTRDNVPFARWSLRLSMRLSMPLKLLLSPSIICAVGNPTLISRQAKQYAPIRNSLYLSQLEDGGCLQRRHTISKSFSPSLSWCTSCRWYHMLCRCGHGPSQWCHHLISTDVLQSHLSYSEYLTTLGEVRSGANSDRRSGPKSVRDAMCQLQQRNLPQEMNTRARR